MVGFFGFYGCFFGGRLTIGFVVVAFTKTFFFGVYSLATASFFFATFLGCLSTITEDSDDEEDELRDSSSD